MVIQFVFFYTCIFLFILIVYYIQCISMHQQIIWLIILILFVIEYNYEYKKLCSLDLLFICFDLFTLVQDSVINFTLKSMINENSKNNSEKFSNCF